MLKKMTIIMALVFAVSSYNSPAQATKLSDISVAQAAMCGGMFISLMGIAFGKSNPVKAAFGTAAFWTGLACFISSADAAEILENGNQGQNSAYSSLEREIGSLRSQQVLHMIADGNSYRDIFAVIQQPETH